MVGQGRHKDKVKHNERINNLIVNENPRLKTSDTHIAKIKKEENETTLVSSKQGTFSTQFTKKVKTLA